MKFNVLHHCHVENINMIDAYLSLVQLDDAIVFFGNNQADKIKEIYQSLIKTTPHVFFVENRGADHHMIYGIDHQQWAQLIEQSKNILSWK